MTDRDAALDADALAPIVYHELRRLAAGYMRRERPGHTLQATALVHEAYMRLADAGTPWHDKRHFIGIAARSMRQILVERARAHGAQKRWAALNRVTLSDALALAAHEDAMLPALDDAMDRLEKVDAELARIVELRFFAGLSIEETSEALQLSPAAVKRRWALARAEVMSLLAHHSRAGDLLSQPIVERMPSLLDDEPYPAGTVVGPYIIEREIGRGGMGRVYLARDDRLGRTVALKVLAPALVGDPAQRERLRREARAAAVLTHPGICTAYALDEIDNGELAIASEFVDGVTLREEIGRRSSDPSTTLETARELAAALASAHARGIVHRDLKPENVMRTFDGRLKILDFGLARLDRPGSPDLRPTLTRTGVLLGTPAYMAPEQLRHESVDARADVFAFGVLMYEYACSVHPLRAEQPHAVPGVLGDVISRCMREIPAERFASASDIVTALDAGPPSIASTRWWQTHQLVVIALYAVAAVLGWQIKEWHETPATVALFLALGAASTVGGVLRGHLSFTDRMNRRRLETERQRTAPAIRLVDLTAGTMPFSDGVLIATTRALPAVAAFALAVGIVLGALVLEPATTAAAFGEDR